MYLTQLHQMTECATPQNQGECGGGGGGESANPPYIDCEDDGVAGGGGGDGDVLINGRPYRFSERGTD
jgi:hypothetical protein